MAPKVISWAQNGEDVVLRRALRDIEVGFYVDVGAADPDRDSVTRMFYDAGWHGINIEPNVDFLDCLVAKRSRDINLRCAVSSMAKAMILHVIPGTGLSTLSSKYAEQHRQDGFEIRQDAVTTRSLDSILDEQGVPEIHFLKIDVEGFEEDVIDSIELSRYRPWIILYEATVPNTSTLVRNGIHGKLEKSGYQFVLFDGLNKYFVANEHSDRARLIFPANVVDNFARFSDVELAANLESAVVYNTYLLRTLQLKDEAIAVLSEKKRNRGVHGFVQRLKRKMLKGIDDEPRMILAPAVATPATIPLPNRLVATQPRAAFTICSWNYLGYAITLRQSLAETNPDLTFYIFVADRPETDVARKLENASVIVVNETIAPDFELMALRYSIMEYNTAVKPHCFDYIFDTLGHRSVVYLDPDILVLGSLDEIHVLLAADFDCVLTPHITAPLDDGKMPDDLAISRAGIYNLGFIGLADRPEARRFVAWWRRWLDKDCVVDIPRGIFVDQRFCDFAPSFIRKTKILHDPGYNLAYWNLLHRPVERRDGTLYAGDSAVKFVHFSGFHKGKPQEFSKHQNRFTRATIGELQPVFDDYVNSIRMNDDYEGGAYSKIPFGFNDPICARQLSVPHLDSRKRRKQRLKREVRRLKGQLFALIYRQSAVTPLPASDGGKRKKSRLRNEVRRVKQQLAQLFLRSPNNTAKSAVHKNPAFVQKPLAGSAAVWPTTAERRRHGLAVYGFLHTETGIGQAGRALSTAFATTGMALSNHALKPPGFDNTVDFPVAANLVNDVDHALLAINADNVRHLAAYMDPALVTANRRIGLFFWELPVFPGIWSSAIDTLDEVWVSTEFVKESLVSATTKPVRVVPLPVPLNDLDREQARMQLGLPAERPIYLVTFDFNSYPQRKNPIASVRAFIDAFPKGSDSSPLLVVKCHGLQNRIGHEPALLNAVAGHNHIQLIDRVMSKPEMLQLQAACDVHVSLHRSEGFGLNLAEAMAAGKLAVATNFSGNVDFMTPANSLLIDYKMQRVKDGDYVFCSGQWWAHPDHDHAVAALRQAESKSARDRLGAQARSDVARGLSNDHVGAIMRRLIDA